MKLTIAGNQIALTEGTVISIERSTPFLNDDTGSFSFPFPVPTLPNQRVLGWPGNLERAGDIPDQTFVLEDSGLQILLGEVDYDEITVNEIGIILKSGFTEFTKRMEGKKLGDIEYGGETWPINTPQVPWTTEALTPITNGINNKLLEWDAANTTNNGKYVVCPFFISRSDAPAWGFVEEVNAHTYDVNYAMGRVSFFRPWSNIGQTSGYGYQEASYSLQFYVSFVLRKIFENAGYTIGVDDFFDSEFNNAIIYSNIIHIAMSVKNSEPVAVIPSLTSLEYKTLMPKIEILDFLKMIQDMFCVMYEIDELKKEVQIKFKKNIFLPENLDGMKIVEMAGWSHMEQKAFKGFALRYKDQDDELDTFTEWPEISIVKLTLPAPTVEGEIFQSSYDRSFITEKNDADTLVWKEVGRLKEVKTGEGEFEVELNVNVPKQTTYLCNGLNFECPSILSISKNPSIPSFAGYGVNVLNKPAVTFVEALYVTLYHGRKTFTTIGTPYTSFDRYSRDGTIDTGMSLKPAYLYDKVYLEFINWQTYRARGFTKYIQLSLLQLLALQWGKRYMINGTVVILDKINYDLPYTGTVEISGFSI